MSRSLLLHPRNLALGLIGSMALTACGSSSPAADSGVVTLAGSTGVVVTEDAAELTDEEAGMALAACARENGIADFPDPVVNADGSIEFGDIRELVQGGTIDRETFQAALEACQGEAGGVGFGGGNRGGGFDQAALQEATLAFTDCLREEGLDVGDLTFDAGGRGPGGFDRGQGEGGDPPADGERPGGPRGGDQGGQEGFIARLLGLDTEDEAVIAALEVCNPLLDTLPAPGQAPADAA